tara:strand:- start:354 stop:3206 length:2853 start_codon:yes stop_codon:yes gene_type:complete
MQLKKFTRKDRHGNMMSFEFDIPQANVPAMQSIPMYDHPGEPKGTDTVPAWLTPGEFVVNKEATEMFGPMIKKINDIGRKKQDQKKTMYAQEGELVADTSWITDDLLDALRFVETGNLKPEDMVSPKGAIGPYQIMPENFGAMEGSKTLGKAGFGTPIITEELAKDPEFSRNWAKKYLEGIQKANPDFTKVDVLRAYNAGVGTVNKVKKGVKNYIPEAQQYPGKVMASLQNIKKNKIPGVTAQKVVPNATSSGAQVATDAKFVPPVNVTMPPKDMASMEPIAGPSSGRIAQLMGNLQPSPTVNITPNTKNVTTDLNEIAEAMAGEYLGERGVLRNMDRGAERRKMFRDAGASFANEFVGIPVPGSDQVIAQPKSVQDAQNMININKGIPDAAPYVPSITNDMLNRRALQEDAEAAVKAAVDTKLPKAKAMPTERDLLNFSGDIDKYIPKVDAPGKSFREVVEQSFDTDIGKERYIPKIISKALEQGKDVDAPMFFPPERTDAAPQGVSTVPKGETETFRGTINKGEPNLGAVDKKDTTDPDADKDNIAQEVVNKTDNDKKPEEKDTKQVEETGGKASNQEKSKVEGFLKGLLGSLFDAKELKRMAVMYLGSRVMGYGHNGSLNFALRNYLTRVDAKEDSRRKFVTTAEAKRDYTGKSLQVFLESGNVSDLVPKQTLIPTQDFKKLYTKNKQGKVIEVIGQKFNKTIGGVTYPVYVDAKGNQLNLRNYQEDPIFFRGSDESKEAVSKYSKEIEEALKSLRNQFGRIGKNKDGTINYVSNINPNTEADVLINYALEEGLDITRFAAAIPMAYKAMLNDPERAGKAKVTSLLGYINDVYMEQSLVENKEMFRVEPFTKAEKEADKGPMVSTKRMEELRQNVGVMIRRNLGESVKGTSDGELFSFLVKKLKPRYDALDPKEKEQFERKAQKVKGRKVENGFFVYVKEYTQKNMK